MLRQSALEIIRRYQLLEVFERYGHVRWHGSFELDLLSWPELDAWIFNDQPRCDATWRLISELSEKAPPTTVFVINERDHSQGINPPNAYLIDFRFLHEGVEWKLDLGMGKYSDHASYLDYNNFFRGLMTPETQKIIKAIKDVAILSRRYRKSRWAYTSASKYFRAVDVYFAVIQHGVSTPREFAEYLRRHRGIDVGSDFDALPPQPPATA